MGRGVLLLRAIRAKSCFIGKTKAVEVVFRFKKKKKKRKLSIFSFCCISGMSLSKVLDCFLS